MGVPTEISRFMKNKPQINEKQFLEDLESLRKEVEELRKQNAAPATESAEPRDV